MTQHWILAHLTGMGAVMASADADRPLDLRNLSSFEASQFSTFTEVVQVFVRKAGLNTRDCGMVLAVAGRVGGDSIKITNGRWFISLSGLSQMLSRPVVAMNDTAALGWAMLASDTLPQHVVRPCSALASGGERRAVIWLGEGLGVACVIRDSAAGLVLDTEGGHLSYPGGSPHGDALLHILARRCEHLSYEKVLTLPTDDPAWEQILGAADLVARRESLRCEILGSFCGEMVLALGAWGGVLLAGDVDHLRRASNGTSFSNAFDRKGRMTHYLRSVPIGISTESHLALRGAANRVVRISSTSLNGLAG